MKRQPDAARLTLVFCLCCLMSTGDPIRDKWTAIDGGWLCPWCAWQ